MPSGYQQIGDCTQQDIDNGPDSYFTIYGYDRDKKYTFVYNILGILFLGIPFIIFSWYPKYKTIKYKKSPLKDASIILLCENSTTYSIINILTETVELPSECIMDLKYFIYHKTKYVWIQSSECFDTLEKLLPESTLTDILHKSSGLLESEQEKLLKLYGSNNIEVEIKSYWRLFIEEVFNPYYVFQIFSIILWCFDNYMIYAGCIFVLTLFSAVTGLLETRKQSEALHDLVKCSTVTTAHILRKNQEMDIIDPKGLVPGDLLIIPREGCIMPCDAVLIQGTCIVNESMLTERILERQPNRL